MYYELCKEVVFIYILDEKDTYKKARAYLVISDILSSWFAVKTNYNLMLLYIASYFNYISNIYQIELLYKDFITLKKIF